MGAQVFESLPTRVEAIHWDGSFDQLADIEEWAQDKVRPSPDSEVGNWVLELLAGKDSAQEWVPVPIGHWVVRAYGDPSDYWPVENDYFVAKYRGDDQYANEYCGCPFAPPHKLGDHANAGPYEDPNA